MITLDMKHRINPVLHSSFHFVRQIDLCSFQRHIRVDLNFNFLFFFTLGIRYQRTIIIIFIRYFLFYVYYYWSCYITLLFYCTYSKLMVQMIVQLMVKKFFWFRWWSTRITHLKYCIIITTIYIVFGPQPVQKINKIKWGHILCEQNSIKI